MQQRKINPIIRWWVTPKLPYEDIFDYPLLMNKSLFAKLSFLYSRWLIHPFKRRIARWYLRRLQDHTGLVVIGVTGSAGKSSTVQMLYSILKRVGKTVATPPSIDPIYNVPNTILKCTSETKYLILEMSVEYPGEMDYYLWLARPDIGVITNIFPSHTEFLGDTGGVLREKSKLVRELSINQYAVLNGRDKQLLKLKHILRSKIVWFGDGTEVMSSKERIDLKYNTEFRLIFDQSRKKGLMVHIPAFGNQYVFNALAASAAAKALMVSLKDIKVGLESFPKPKHRMEVIKHKSGAVIFDDSYNSNPSAAKESVYSFTSAAWNKDKIVVFGDMLELGNLEIKHHLDLGSLLGKSHLSKLICVGTRSKVTAKEASKLLGSSRVVVVANWQEALKELKPYLRKGSAILVKGSRSIALDKLVEKLV